jgi:hypothetical protein
MRASIMHADSGDFSPRCGLSGANVLIGVVSLDDEKGKEITCKRCIRMLNRQKVKKPSQWMRW